jgi:hypothetical protein
MAGPSHAWSGEGLVQVLLVTGKNAHTFYVYRYIAEN